MSRLLKSWAMPPASRPRLSSFCVWACFCCASSSAVMSRVKPTIRTAFPDASRISTPDAETQIARPSRCISRLRTSKRGIAPSMKRAHLLERRRLVVGVERARPGAQLAAPLLDGHAEHRREPRAVPAGVGAQVPVPDRRLARLARRGRTAARSPSPRAGSARAAPGGSSCASRFCCRSRQLRGDPAADQPAEDDEADEDVEPLHRGEPVGLAEHEQRLRQEPVRRAPVEAEVAALDHGLRRVEGEHPEQHRDQRVALPRRPGAVARRARGSRPRAATAASRSPVRRRPSSAGEDSALRVKHAGPGTHPLARVARGSRGNGYPGEAHPGACLPDHRGRTGQCRAAERTSRQFIRRPARIAASDRWGSKGCPDSVNPFELPRTPDPNTHAAYDLVLPPNVVASVLPRPTNPPRLPRTARRPTRPHCPVLPAAQPALHCPVLPAAQPARHCPVTAPALTAPSCHCPVLPAAQPALTAPSCPPPDPP